MEASSCTQAPKLPEDLEKLLHDMFKKMDKDGVCTAARNARDAAFSGHIHIRTSAPRLPVLLMAHQPTTAWRAAGPDSHKGRGHRFLGQELCKGTPAWLRGHYRSHVNGMMICQDFKRGHCMCRGDHDGLTHACNHDLCTDKHSLKMCGRRPQA